MKLAGAVAGNSAVDPSWWVHLQEKNPVAANPAKASSWFAILSHPFRWWLKGRQLRPPARLMAPA
jgi:hypothetical protein